MHIQFGKLYSVFTSSASTYTGSQNTGAFVSGGNCPGQAVHQCVARRGRELRQPKVKRSDSTWDTPPSYPDPSPYEPSPPPYKPSPSPSKPSSYSWKPYTPPSSQPPCNFRCPQQDLAQSPLTDEAIRDSCLFCSFSTSHCKTCSFCKYSTVRLRVEDSFCSSLTELGRQPGSFSRTTTMAIARRRHRLLVRGIAATFEALFLGCNSTEHAPCGPFSVVTS